MASSSAKRKGRGPSWTEDDLQLMLDIVRDILPQGGNGWAKVAAVFNKNEAASVARDAEGIKRKFISLKNHKKPTVDPDFPAEVVRAKRIQREIDNDAAVLTLDDGEGEDNGMDLAEAANTSFSLNYDSEGPAVSSDDQSERNESVIVRLPRAAETPPPSNPVQQPPVADRRQKDPIGSVCQMLPWPRSAT